MQDRESLRVFYKNGKIKQFSFFNPKHLLRTDSLICLKETFLSDENKIKNFLLTERKFHSMFKAFHFNVCMSGAEVSRKNFIIPKAQAEYKKKTLIELRFH